MTALRIILDPIVAPQPDESGRYAFELTRELIATAPSGVAVEGAIASSPSSVYERLERELPGLAELHKSALDPVALRRLWRRGVGFSHGGMVHAHDLLAPLARHDHDANPGVQTVVTVHDTLAWTAPSWLGKGEAAWRVAMLRRAERFADAIIVPNHTVADALHDFGSFRDRIRVIAGGTRLASAKLSAKPTISNSLELPERYLLTAGSGSARRSLMPLLKGLSRTDGPEIPLVLLGLTDVDAACNAAGLDRDRVIVMNSNDRDVVGAVFAGASLYVHPGPADGFGLSILDAMAAGVPVVHGDEQELVELTADAALVVSRKDVAGFTASLAQHLDALLDDAQTMERMRFSGRDRARFFNWQDAAEKVWQLHADL